MAIDWSVPTQRACVTVHAFLTLDGYVADPSLPQMMALWDKINTEQCSQYMLERSDALIVGRHTYQALMTDDEWPYPECPTYVLTRRPVDVDHPCCVSEQPLELLLQSLPAKLQRHVWLIGGRQLVLRAMQESLLDEIVIHMLPMTQGEGQLFFEQLQQIDFDLIDVVRLAHGVIRMHYRVLNAEALHHTAATMSVMASVHPQ
jgi:dihydrofolate reductase